MLFRAGALFVVDVQI